MTVKTDVGKVGAHRAIPEIMNQPFNPYPPQKREFDYHRIPGAEEAYRGNYDRIFRQWTDLGQNPDTVPPGNWLRESVSGRGNVEVWVETEQRMRYTIISG